MEQRIGIIMNGITGRMGLNQHLIRSVLAIRDMGGLPLVDGSKLMPDPILVGRNKQKVEEIAKRLSVSRFTTDLSNALENPDDMVDELVRAATRVGYPLLLKASAGGGGKGMRVVREPRNLQREYAAASREATTSFGDGTVYVERLLEKSRHVEIQVLTDKLGNAIHLFERECSIQRRHQKVLEEALSPVLNESQRDNIGEVAAAAVRRMGYKNAGTIEFLYYNDDFYFIESNPCFTRHFRNNFFVT